MINPWILAAMVPAVTVLMLHLGVGPFGHPSLLPLHAKWRRTPMFWQILLVFLAVLTLIIGATHLLGLWTFATSQ